MLSFAPTPRRVNRQSHPYTVSRGVLSTYAISSILFSCFRWIAPNNRNLGLAFFSCAYIVFNCCKETSGKNCFPLARFHILITSKTKEFKDKQLFKSFEIKEISYYIIRIYNSKTLRNPAINSESCLIFHFQNRKI